MGNQDISVPADGWQLPVQIAFLALYGLPWVINQSKEPEKRTSRRILRVYLGWGVCLFLAAIFTVHMQSEYLPDFIEAREIMQYTRRCKRRVLELGCHRPHSPDVESECFGLAMCVVRPLENLYTNAFAKSSWDLLTRNNLAYTQLTFFAASIIATIFVL